MVVNEMLTAEQSTKAFPSNGARRAMARTSGRRIKALERQQEAIRLRMLGRTFSEIGLELGMSKAGAFKAVTSALEATKEDIAERTDDLRAVWAERLEAMARAVLPAALEGDLAAHDRLVKIADRFARLTGMDLRPDAGSGLTIQLVESRPPWEREGWGEGEVIEGESRPLELPAGT